MMTILRSLSLCSATVFLILVTKIAPADGLKAARYLYQGSPRLGAEDLKKLQATQPDDQLQFEIGTLQFFSALEFLGQKFYQHGKLDSSFGLIPFFRLDLDVNHQPDKISYLEFREVLSEFQRQIDTASITLSLVKSENVKLQLDLSQVYLDLNGDSVTSNNERLLVITQRVFRDLQEQDNLVVDFDYADAIWLQGYCNLASALCDLALSVDFEESWNAGARAFFAAADTPYTFLTEEIQNTNISNLLIDLVAMLHKSNFPVKERDRLISCHTKLLRMVELSRENWNAINNEKDHEREWLPNARQTGFRPRLLVQQEMITAWGGVLNEWEAILQGKKLVPFWRGSNAKLGLNLKRVFYEIDNIDPIMIAQGADVVRFLEEGALTSTGDWASLSRAFRGDFIGFAIWAN